MREFGPIRTALFVPGNRPDRIDKAVRAGADAVIIDLEDAVPLAQKDEARPAVREKVLEHGSAAIIVRINGLDTEFFARDVAGLVAEGLRCLMIPKIEGPEHIRRADEALRAEERARGMDPGSVSILPLIESAAAIQHVFSILSERTDPPRIVTAALGAADFALDMGIEMTARARALDYPRARIAVACRAAGVASPIDSPYMIDIRDLEGLRADAMRARALGFQGKLCIHPCQVAPCREVFSPTEEEILFARRVVDAFEEAEAEGRAALELDGKFIDYAIVERSRRILDRAGGDA